VKHREPERRAPPATGHTPPAPASAPVPPQAKHYPRHAPSWDPAPRRTLPEAPRGPRRRTRAHAADRRSVGCAAAVRAPPERRSTAGSISRCHPTHPVLERLLRPLLTSRRAIPSPLRRHSRRRPVLEPAARARRRPAAPVGPLGPVEAQTLACCPTLPLPAALSRDAAATAAGRRRTLSSAIPSAPTSAPLAPRWASRRVWPLARPRVPPARRNFGRSRTASSGQGPDC
jgi:hypothetical protein